MSFNDPVADFLTRIRNALLRKHETVSIPASKLKASLAQVLKQEGFIEDFQMVKDDRGHDAISITLKYVKGASVIRGLKRISSPGLRQYAGYRDVKPVMAGQGVSILSTSKGVMTELKCQEEKAGGELLCQVW
ncbi:MAG: 30S ribosomal protein S8 [Deltaproteobacteria bacterium]|nr:30S ribosomal protein S8 [Deltaproteobacteria bacterium]